MPVDLYGKTVLIIGFGKIGTRSAKRFAAMETHVLVYDPYMYSATVHGMGYEPVQDLDAAVARADFITIHCPKTPETIGLFDAARLAHMKRTAFIVNTARGTSSTRSCSTCLKRHRRCGPQHLRPGADPPRTTRS